MDLQREIDKLDCRTAEVALQKLGGQGRGEYFFLYNFIKHIERLQSVQKLPAILKPKDQG